MSYVSIREYEVTDCEAVAKIAEEHWVPIIKSIEGFESWKLVVFSSNKLSTISTFKTKEGAKESNDKALAWGGEALDGLVVKSPIISDGNVRVDQ